MTADQNTAFVAKQDQLKQLAAFAPIFRDSRFCFGEWQPMTGKGTLSEPLTTPWFKFSEVADRFIQMLYDARWVNPDFDWPKWYDSPEWQKLYGHPEAIVTADAEQLAKLLTTLVRQDRFCEGTLAKAYEDKILLAIVERAESLLAARGRRNPKRG
jgi:hypothetical protein